MTQESYEEILCYLLSQIKAVKIAWRDELDARIEQREV